MKSLIPKEIKKKLLNFKKQNKSILKDWQSMKNEAKDEIFKIYCKKDYYDSCEPSYCSFFHSKECKYPIAIKELYKITEGN